MNIGTKEDEEENPVRCSLKPSTPASSHPTPPPPATRPPQTAYWSGSPDRVLICVLQSPLTRTDGPFARPIAAARAKSNPNPRDPRRTPPPPPPLLFLLCIAANNKNKQTRMGFIPFPFLSLPGNLFPTCSFPLPRPDPRGQHILDGIHLPLTVFSPPTPPPRQEHLWHHPRTQ